MSNVKPEVNIEFFLLTNAVKLCHVHIVTQHKLLSNVDTFVT